MGKVALKAKCQDCGEVFASQISQELVVDDAGEVRMKFSRGYGHDFCPKCGSRRTEMLAEQAQSYQVIAAGAKILALLPVEDLLTAQEQLRMLQSGELTVEQAQSVAPDQLSGLWSILPKTRTELYAAVTVLVAVVNLILNFRPHETAPAISPAQLEQILKTVVEDVRAHDAK